MGMLDKVLMWEDAGVPSVRTELSPVPAAAKRDPITGQS